MPASHLQLLAAAGQHSHVPDDPTTRRLQSISTALLTAAASSESPRGTERSLSAAGDAGSPRNGGAALVAQLAAEGARLVCGVPGAGQYEATDALFEHPTTRYMSTRNEQAASMVADGFARVTGGVGVVLVVPGPGFYSAAAGLISANSVYSKVLAITGAPHYIHGSSTATTKQDLDLLRPLCKWAGRAETAAEISSQVHEAFVQMNSGRPGTAVLEIGARELREEVLLEALPPHCRSSVAPSTRAVAAACDLLLGASRPLLWVGAGAADAVEPVRQLAELLGCGVVSSIQGKGTLSDRHPLSLGSAELRFAPLKAYVESCDVVLAIGTTSNRIPASATGIRIDIAAEGAASDLYLRGDARVCLEAILSNLKAVDSDLHRNEETKRAIAAINAERHGATEQIEPQAGYMAAIRAALPDDAVVISGMNQMGYYCRSYLKCYQPRTLLTLTPHITLGSEYPLALGAKVGVDQRNSDNGSRRNTPVVSVCGDGGFAYSMYAYPFCSAECAVQLGRLLLSTGATNSNGARLCCLQWRTGNGSAVRYSRNRDPIQ